ncbi:TPA: hypothetical protein I7682_17955 [Vibrio vulnificus]|nr:hypothetical protein [Vibrio vulnificus]
MRIANGLVISFFIIVVGLFSPVSASEKTNEHELKDIKVVDSEYLKQLNLTPKEWERYQQIMTGPMGSYYRRGTANVFYVLGAEAQNEQASLEYARRWLIANDQYAAKLSKMLKMYHAASIDHYGESPRLFDEPGTKPTFQIPEVNKVTNLFIGLTDCATCGSEVENELKRLIAGEISGLNLYFVGVKRDEVSKIQSWAKAHKIPVDFVKQRRVTLNFAPADTNLSPEQLPKREVRFLK